MKSAIRLIFASAALCLLIAACKSDCEKYKAESCAISPDLCKEAEKNLALWKSAGDRCSGALDGIEALKAMGSSSQTMPGAPEMDPKLGVPDINPADLDKLPGANKKKSAGADSP